ncbi:energy coupling factor transporter S component ThiW [Jeotgalibacillus sp. ET6]|uniref:energy coupling factor transporter S component ThiW n=1 Tax=Jeotgalibacillus sp. ET6 TaxID=3037260 RepID=UPI00241849FB|nr:energy coupling factor transporter S component ThiW [Jeotgalibacillus sp. ET6]MDG5472590.1 energy coupling factor transporter S component ThiW [Jeotgalibacillus sp. ET6]
MTNTKRMTVMAMFVAIGVAGAQFIWFPAGVARAYPVQHAVNVMAAIILGPIPAVVIAFLIGLIRNLLGLGSLLAFPGGMIGALFAGLLYKKFGRKGWAAAGEIIGTGFIGAWFAVPFAKVLMGTAFAAWFFVPPFLISSATGAALGWLVLARVKQERLIRLQ